MPESRQSALREILRPWGAKFVFWGPLLATAYQFGCDQFGLPTLPRAWNVTGAAFPWWGWLIVAQSGFLYALFEYVRRRIGAGAAPENQNSEPAVYDDTALRQHMSAQLGAINDVANEAMRVASAADAKLAAINETLAPLISERREKRKAELLGKLEHSRLTRPEPGAKWTYAVGMMGLSTERDVLPDMVRRYDLGLDARKIIEGARAAVKANALNCTIQDKEVGVWLDERSKQRWLAHNAAIEALIRATKEA